MTKQRILSGVRPTGMLHLGNYWGAIKQFIDFEAQDVDRFYFVADLHALTTARDNSLDLAAASIEIIKGYLACGVDPEKSCIYRQSSIDKIPYLAQLFGMFTSEAWLRRCTTYKEQSSKQQVPSLGLLGYPVLMAADILIINANQVPVGHDQLQHLEMTRDIAEKFNNQYGELFAMPAALKLNAIRLQGLSGKGKMSKSENNYIGLFEEPAVITKKIKSAVTDSGTPTKEMAQSTKNLYALLKLHSPKAVYDEYLERYKKGDEKFYGALKNDLAKYVVEMLDPMRQKYNSIKSSYVHEILEAGKKRANLIAEQTFSEVLKRMKI